MVIVIVIIGIIVIIVVVTSASCGERPLWPRPIPGLHLIIMGMGRKGACVRRAPRGV